MLIIDFGAPQRSTHDYLADNYLKFITIKELKMYYTLYFCAASLAPLNQTTCNHLQVFGQTIYTYFSIFKVKKYNFIKC